MTVLNEWCGSEVRGDDVGVLDMPMSDVRPRIHCCPDSKCFHEQKLPLLTRTDVDPSAVMNSLISAVEAMQVRSTWKALLKCPCNVTTTPLVISVALQSFCMKGVAALLEFSRQLLVWSRPLSFILEPLLEKSLVPDEHVQRRANDGRDAFLLAPPAITACSHL